MESLDLDVPIEVDVYELLWRSRVRTYLPESIVFKFGRLDSWFFTACEKGGQPRIKRKRDYTVRRGDVVENIVSSFCAHAVGDHDIVATWIAGQQGENCKMMHITASTLLRFLEHIKGSETGHGVLQRWSVPFGGHSTMLRTDWTPHHFGLEMCTNWHSVNDTRQPLAERLATFDGFKRHVTNTSVVNQNLHAQVEMLNTEIARRINVLQIDSGTKVWSLQCHFKPCADGHVRFIWASRISLEQIDGTGYAVEREEDDPLASASITSSITSIIMQKDAPYHAPVAKKWSGEPTPCDGSIFHIPLPGMTSFREPSWWGAEKLVGITNLLPSATAPAPRPALPKAPQGGRVNAEGGCAC